MNENAKKMKVWLGRMLKEGLFQPVELAVEVFKAISPYQPKEGSDAKTGTED